MGGKKKTLANRLARMSDEERARYLQHKADVEEEARRRKEQLIATFMKNKIRKEDGFSRLNLAKINQQWHQVLRVNKCKEMKEDVEHMKKYIERVLEYKNRTIEKLLEELEMAEAQYAHNFQAHITHIDQTIDWHRVNLQALDEQYREDLAGILATARKEREEFVARATGDQQNLRTVIFGQFSKAEEARKQTQEHFAKKRDNITSTHRLLLDACSRRREAQSAAIWRQIAALVRAHVHQTDTRRLHLAELKRLDAESAAEIARNQERITLQEGQILNLTRHYDDLVAKQTEKIATLTAILKRDHQVFNAARQRFRNAIEADEGKIVYLSDRSGFAIQHLETLRVKGEQIVNLVKTCGKFETKREQVMRFQPVPPLLEVAEMDESRPASSKSVVEKIVISTKPAPQEPVKLYSVDKQIDVLMRLEKFWLGFSKVRWDFKELTVEKMGLLEQNKQLRGMVRAVLEAAAMAKSRPGSRIPTRTASKSRSAPLRRILI